MKHSGIDILVSLLEVEEAASLGLEEEGPMSLQAGLQFIQYPIPDRTTPEAIKTFREFVAGLANLIRAGQSIGVHCRGSIGRATITAACTLTHLGWSPDAALTAIEKVRGCPVPDTPEQQQWILNYRVQP
jgi:protein-tyrosine phosphatase